LRPVFLADTAKLMTPFVNLALVPEAASSWLLPAGLGTSVPTRCFALGEPLDAATALACGLANAVVPVAGLACKAREAAEALTKRPAGSLNQTKALMRDMDKIAAQISREGALFRERLQTAEAREAFAAFAERRKPDFSKVAGRSRPSDHKQGRSLTRSSITQRRQCPGDLGLDEMLAIIRRRVTVRQTFCLFAASNAAICDVLAR